MITLEYLYKNKKGVSVDDIKEKNVLAKDTYIVYGVVQGRRADFKFRVFKTDKYYFFKAERNEEVSTGTNLLELRSYIRDIVKKKGLGKKIEYSQDKRIKKQEEILDKIFNEPATDLEIEIPSEETLIGSNTLMEKVNIRPGESWNVKIENFFVSKERAMRLNLRFRNHNRYIDPGTYTRLYIDRNLMMSDTPAEMRDHYPFYKKAKGKILVAGLWLWMIAQALIKKKEVEELTVVEYNKHVIRLVKPSLDPRIKVIQADIFEYVKRNDISFDMAWLDIWYDICGENVKEMEELKKHLVGKVPRVFCWGEQLCRNILKKSEY